MQSELSNKNESGLKPLGHSVLVRNYEPVRKGIIEIPDQVRERTQLVEQRAVVIAVGSEAWKDEGQPRAVPGDRVLVSKYAGFIAKGPADGRLYRVLNASDVFCGITSDEMWNSVGEGVSNG